VDLTRVLYEPIEDVERMENYRAGGYHLVTVGDRLNDCYQIIHKLGHGTYSTIWLARDDETQQIRCSQSLHSRFEITRD
jgi:serine/threonine protein kinase